MEDFEQAIECYHKMKDALSLALVKLRHDLLSELRAARTAQEARRALKNLVDRHGNAVTVKLTVDGIRMTTMEKVAEYIYYEMLVNQGSEAADKIRSLNRIFKNKGVSYIEWTLLVGPGMDWDHKPHIFQNYGRFSYDAITRRLYGYDIWSDIHYGYIGYALGFTSEELTVGAGVANILSSSGKSIIEYGKADDPRDQTAILLGIQLWEAHGSSLDMSTFIATVRDWASSLATFICDYVAMADR